MKKITNYKYGIYKFDNFIQPKVCDQLVEYISQEVDLLKLPNLNSMPWFDQETIDWKFIQNKSISKHIQNIRKKTTKFVSRCYKQKIYPNFTDIVVWKTGRFMGEHVDDGSNLHPSDTLRDSLCKRIYSSVLYLNDNYEGGETFINSKHGKYISIPKKGTIVIFKSNLENSHGVNIVKSGVRYTLPMWFTINYEFREHENDR